MSSEEVYRVTREDTRDGFYHQPLIKIGTKRMLDSLVKDEKDYGRYKITKVEKLEGEWTDITDEYR